MKVFINPGHAPNGIPDPGAVNSDTGLRECDVALEVGTMVKKYLEAVGYEVKLLQSDDLWEICQDSNNWESDIFISIHCNACNGAAKGVETWHYYSSRYGKQLADCIQKQIARSIYYPDGTPIVNRGIKGAQPGRNGLYVLSNTDAVACLVEMAFIDNPDDEKLLRDWQDEFPRAIARGVTDFDNL